MRDPERILFLTTLLPMDSLRFQFGENWQSFLNVYTPDRLQAAAQSIKELTGRESLAGMTFLDAGSGSGLFSAAAFALGASVTSFDFDANSVQATASLRPDDAGSRWHVMQGSLLDAAFMSKIGCFDIVYCWGVAHHTGAMYEALANLCPVTGDLLVVSIYNDQGKPSKRWRAIKRMYNRYPILRPVLIGWTWMRLWAVKFLQDAMRGHPGSSWTQYRSDARGMSARHDLIDWVGGYPFEVARPEQIFEFFRARGMHLHHMRTHAGGIGCNEFVFGRRNREN